METVLRNEYVFDRLCCPDCAKIIEREINGLAGVSDAKVDFATRTLILSTHGAGLTAPLSREIEAIAGKYDSGITLSGPEPGKKSIYLRGLDCAECARKIENAVGRLDGVSAARLDFANQRLSIEVYDKNNKPAVLAAAEKIAREIEPDVSVSYAGDRSDVPADSKTGRKLSYAGLLIGAALFAIGLILGFSPVPRLIIFLASLILAGGEIVLKALRNMVRGSVFDENLLMSIAAAGAFALGDYPEGVAVMLFYRVGELLQDLAVNRSRKSISALLDIRPDYANIMLDGELKRVSPEQVGVGDMIMVRPGERIPLDGVVVEGRSALDTSALTGESLPREVSPGDDALSGSVNKSGLLTIKVTKEFGESTVSRILELVENAAGNKARAENFITKFARYYTPAVVFSALLLALVPPLVLPGALFSDWIKRALIFLVVSCPCALVISIPLGFFGGIGGASRRGILIKGSNYLEALNRVDTVVFDKTGTLTRGSFRVTKIKASEGFSEDEVLSLASLAESFSAHPIALSIREARGGASDAGSIDGYEEIPGQGVRMSVGGRALLAGNAKLMKSENIPLSDGTEHGTLVHVAADGKYAGYIVISDQIKPDAAGAIGRLHESGVKKTVMLTGDSREAGERVGSELGLDEVYTGLLPQEKVEKLEHLIKAASPGRVVVFVGDGINDAPVLARADVGVAMGALGSDAAIEAADIVLMTDEPSKLADALGVAKKTHRIVWQNIIFALSVKALFLTLGALGIATMWEAVFGDVGVTVLAVLNSTRAMR